MRFSIRDLLSATLVVALCFGWWKDNQTKHAAIQQAHRLHHSLDVAKKWHDLGQSGYFDTTTGVKNVLLVPSTPPDWTPLDEPLVERSQVRS
jgi:hypothetical protein